MTLICTSTSYAGGWMDYVNVLRTKANCKQAGIFGLRDGVTWATDKGFTPTPAEIIHIGKSFDDPTIVRANGAAIMGVRYMGYEVSQDIISVKKGPVMIFAAHGKKSTVLCLVDNSAIYAKARLETMNFASYMTSIGF